MAKLVIKRYATALFDLAASEGKMQQFEEEIRSIVLALKEEPDFISVLQNQKITLGEKVLLIERIFANKADASIVGLMVIVVRKGRQEFLLDIFEAFLEMAKHKKGILRATVTSAVPLKDSQLEQIKSRLEMSTKSQIELNTIIDESIIAGLVVRVGDKVVDASIKGNMQNLKKQLTELRLA